MSLVNTAIAQDPVLTPKQSSNASTVASSVPATLARQRFLAATAAAVLVAFILLLGVSSLMLRNQLVETQADLATTQAELASTQADLASTQADLATTQANLATTQANLAATQADRDSLAGQVDSLNANVSNLTSERDTLKTNLDHARADVDRFTAELNAANSDLDTARNGSQLLAQAAALLADVTRTNGEYDQVVGLQLNDLLAAYNAAVRLDYTTQRVAIQRYNDRLFLQGQKANAVTQAFGRLDTFLRSHPGS